MEGKSRTLTIPEVVKASPVPISESTLRRAVREQRLPAQLVFGKYRIAEEDFNRFLHGKPASGSAA